MVRGAITALQDAGIQHVVFLSTSQVSAAGDTAGDIRSVDRQHVIPWQHAQVEIALGELGVPHTALRPGFFASNPLRIYLDSSTEPKHARLLAPEVLHHPMDPADIGRVAGALLVNPRRRLDAPAAGGESIPLRKDVVYLSGPTLLSQMELCDIVNRKLAVAGKPQAKVTHSTVDEYLANLTAGGVPEMVAKSLAKSMTETRALPTTKGLYEEGMSNVELLAGRKPTSFEDFVRQEINELTTALEGQAAEHASTSSETTTRNTALVASIAQSREIPDERVPDLRIIKHMGPQPRECSHSRHPL